MSRPCAFHVSPASPASPASRINTERRSSIISSGRNAATDAATNVATNVADHLPASAPPPPAHPRPPSCYLILQAAEGLVEMSTGAYREEFLRVVNELLSMILAAQGMADLSTYAYREEFFRVVDEEYYNDTTWYSTEAINSMCLAAHYKALVRLSAPHSPQPIGYTSTGEPIFSATIVPQ